MTDRQKLLKILTEKSYQKKKVVLASGKTSDFYIDVRQTALHAEGAYLIGKLLFEKLNQGEKVEAVGGPTLGADPVCTSISVVSFLNKKPLSAFIVRKEPKKHGLSQWIEGDRNLSKGMSVAVVEDVVTTGGSLLSAISKVAAQGFVIKRVLCVVDRGEGGSEALREKGFALESLFTKSDF